MHEPPDPSLTWPSDHARLMWRELVKRRLAEAEDDCSRARDRLFALEQREGGGDDPEGYEWQEAGAEHNDACYRIHLANDLLVVLEGAALSDEDLENLALLRVPFSSDLVFSS